MAQGKSFIFNIGGNNDFVPIPPKGKYHYYSDENDPALKAINNNGEVIDLSGVEMGQALFVSKNNNIFPSERGKMAKSFPSIQSAIDAANPGDTVFVLPGIYQEGITLRDQVNLHFYNGAIINLDHIDNYIISDANNRVSCNITGFGIFRQVNHTSPISSQLNQRGFSLYGGGEIYIEGKEIYKNIYGSFSDIIVVVDNTNLDLNFNNIISKSFSNGDNDHQALRAQNNGKITAKSKNIVVRGYVVDGHSGNSFIDVEANNIISFASENGAGIGHNGNDSWQTINYNIKAKNIFGLGESIALKDDNSDTIYPDINIEADNIYSYYGENIQINTNVNKFNLKNANIINFNKGNALNISNSVNKLQLNNCFFQGNISSSVSQDSIIRGNLLLDGNNDANFNVTGGSLNQITDDNFHKQKFEWYWKDKIFVKDEEGNNVGEYRRKTLHSRKFINDIELVDASSQPPTQNDGDEYILNYSSPVHSSWSGDSASNGDHVKYISSSDTWNVVENIPKEYSNYNKKVFDITNAFSYTDQYGNYSIFDYSAITDFEFSQLSSSQYSNRLKDFYGYVYFSVFPNDFDKFDFYNADQIDVTTINLLNVKNIATNKDENANGIILSASNENTSYTTTNLNSLIGVPSTVYYSVYPDGDSKHTKDEIKNGTGATYYNSVKTDGRVHEIVRAVGLQQNTSYHIDYYAETDSGDEIDVKQTDTFTTKAWADDISFVPFLLLEASGVVRSENNEFADATTGDAVIPKPVFGSTVQNFTPSGNIRVIEGFNTTHYVFDTGTTGQCDFDNTATSEFTFLLEFFHADAMNFDTYITNHDDQNLGRIRFNDQNDALLVANGTSILMDISSVSPVIGKRNYLVAYKEGDVWYISFDGGQNYASTTFAQNPTFNTVFGEKISVHRLLLMNRVMTQAEIDEFFNFQSFVSVAPESLPSADSFAPRGVTYSSIPADNKFQEHKIFWHSHATMARGPKIYNYGDYIFWLMARPVNDTYKVEDILRIIKHSTQEVSDPILLGTRDAGVENNLSDTHYHGSQLFYDGKWWHFEPYQAYSHIYPLTSGEYFNISHLSDLEIHKGIRGYSDGLRAHQAFAAYALYENPFIVNDKIALIFQERDNIENSPDNSPSVLSILISGDGGQSAIKRRIVDMETSESDAWIYPNVPVHTGNIILMGYRYRNTSVSPTKNPYWGMLYSEDEGITWRNALTGVVVQAIEDSNGVNVGNEITEAQIINNAIFDGSATPDHVAAMAVHYDKDSDIIYGVRAREGGGVNWFEFTRGQNDLLDKSISIPNRTIINYQHQEGTFNDTAFAYRKSGTEKWAGLMVQETNWQVALTRSTDSGDTWSDEGIQTDNQSADYHRVYGVENQPETDKKYLFACEVTSESNQEGYPWQKDVTNKI